MYQSIEEIHSTFILLSKNYLIFSYHDNNHLNSFINLIYAIEKCFSGKISEIFPFSVNFSDFSDFLKVPKLN